MPRVFLVEIIAVGQIITLQNIPFNFGEGLIQSEYYWDLLSKDFRNRFHENGDDHEITKIQKELHGFVITNINVGRALTIL